MGEEKSKSNRSAFLVGNLVYLRPPDIQKDVIDGKWFSWFNNKEITKYLERGVYPNTVQKQIEYVESLKDDKTKVVLCIIDKVSDKHIGVISISNINLINRKANISIVMGEKKYSIGAPLEAMALMTEYAFDRLNLVKLNAGQSIKLWKWVDKLELIGYRIEGYIEAGMIRDGEIHDCVHTGITAKRFYDLKKLRKGKICTENIVELLAKRRKENLIDDVKKMFLNLYQQKGYKF